LTAATEKEKVAREAAEKFIAEATDKLKNAEGAVVVA